MNILVLKKQILKDEESIMMILRGQEGIIRLWEVYLQSFYCEAWCWLCVFYEIGEEMPYGKIFKAVWGDLGVRNVGWIRWRMAIFYWVENQAGERVGVENHPGSGYSGRQCRPLKSFVRDVKEIDDCGLFRG